MLHNATQSLIIKLAEMTRQQKLVWAETSNSVFRYETEGYQVHLTQSPIEVLLTDLSGREIERADAQELTETEAESGESFARLVANLRKDVARQVRGTDAAIASILAGLDFDGTSEPVMTEVEPAVTEAETADSFVEYTDETLAEANACLLQESVADTPENTHSELEAQDNVSLLAEEAEEAEEAEDEASLEGANIDLEEIPSISPAPSTVHDIQATERDNTALLGATAATSIIGAAALISKLRNDIKYDPHEAFNTTKTESSVRLESRPPKKEDPYDERDQGVQTPEVSEEKPYNRVNITNMMGFDATGAFGLGLSSEFAAETPVPTLNYEENDTETEETEETEGAEGAEGTDTQAQDAHAERQKPKEFNLNPYSEDTTFIVPHSVDVTREQNETPLIFEPETLTEAVKTIKPEVAADARGYHFASPEGRSEQSNAQDLNMNLISEAIEAANPRIKAPKISVQDTAEKFAADMFATNAGSDSDLVSLVTRNVFGDTVPLSLVKERPSASSAITIVDETPEKSQDSVIGGEYEQYNPWS